MNSACCCSTYGWYTDQAESDYEDEDMGESPEQSSQDHNQYHGKGWRAKKQKAPSQTASMPPTDDVRGTHTADQNEQAIWSTDAEPQVAEQDANSEQSSSTVYAEDAPVTSRSDRLRFYWGYWHTTSPHRYPKNQVVGMNGRLSCVI